MSVAISGEKRLKDIDETVQKARIVLLDIEGTTTSISFVKDTLFPYIRDNLKQYVDSHWEDAEFQGDLVLLREQARKDEANQVEGVIPIPEGSDGAVKEAVIKNVLWQMDLDRKTAALKQLQGHVMQLGYTNGDLKGHVYADVVPALRSWVRNGKEIFVYSSGSVAAQKLLFGHSEEGNILELFSGNFDTEIGPKMEASSYSNISKKLDCSNGDILFLTDIPKEARAAQEAGLNAILVVRPGNVPLSEEDCMAFAIIKSFHDLVFEVSAKRKKLSVEDSALNSDLINGPTGKSHAVSNVNISSTNDCIEDVEMIDVGGAGDAPKGSNVK